MCTKCPEMFFTQEGYQRHLFKDHKVGCFDKHLPQVIEKIVTRCSQETYETNNRVVNTKNSDKGGDAVTNTDTTSQHIDMLEEENAKETLEEDVNVNMKSGEQSKINENDENIENIFVSSEGPSKKNRKGKKCRGKKSHLTSRKKKTVSDRGNEEESEAYKRLRKAMQNMYAFNKEEPMVKCICCEIYFYSEDGMRTHFQHAHTNMKGIGVSAINDFVTDATLNDASTHTNVPDTAESELPDIIPLTQTVTHGRKRNQNECDTTVHNKKHSRGSPFSKYENTTKGQQENWNRKKSGDKNISEVNLRSKKSEVSDDSTPTSIHFTRSQRTGMQRNDDEVPHETVKQNKRKSNSKDFGTKPIPEKKKKKQVDAIEIVQTHTKKNVDQNEEETQKGTAQLSKKSDRKEYATRSKGNVECHNEKQIPIVEESDEMTKDGKKPKSTKMTLEKKNRKNRQSAETSDDHGKAPTVKSKEIDKPKNKRNKRQTSETSDDSAQVSMSTANEVTETKKQRRNRNKSGNSVNTAQPSTSSGSIPAQSDGGRTTRSKSKKPDNEKIHCQ